MLLQSKYELGDYVQAYTNVKILWIKMEYVRGEIVFIGFDRDHFYYVLVENPDDVQQYHINKSVSAMDERYQPVQSYVVSEDEIEGIVE